MATHRSGRRVPGAVLALAEEGYSGSEAKQFLPPGQALYRA